MGWEGRKGEGRGGEGTRHYCNHNGDHNTQIRSHTATVQHCTHPSYPPHLNAVRQCRHAQVPLPLPLSPALTDSMFRNCVTWLTGSVRGEQPHPMTNMGRVRPGSSKEGPITSKRSERAWRQEHCMCIEETLHSATAMLRGQGSKHEQAPSIPTREGLLLWAQHNIQQQTSQTTSLMTALHFACFSQCEGKPSQ